MLLAGCSFTVRSSFVLLRLAFFQKFLEALRPFLPASSPLGGAPKESPNGDQVATTQGSPSSAHATASARPSWFSYSLCVQLVVSMDSAKIQFQVICKVKGRVSGSKGGPCRVCRESAVQRQCTCREPKPLETPTYIDTLVETGGGPAGRFDGPNHLGI